MAVTGAWEIYGIAGLPFKVGVAAVPAGGNDKVRDVLYVDPLMILKGSKNPEAAFEWIKYLVSEEVQVKSIELGGNPPANTKAFAKYFSSFPGIDAKDMENIVNGGIKYGAESYNHLIVNYSQILDIVRNEQAPMDNENVPAEKVQNIIQEKVTEFLKSQK
jgi:multiple sugar transport system substrate-binding protein